MEEEKDVKKIVIHYEDGTEKVIDKGFFCNMKEEDGSAVLEFTMCHVSGREIELIVEGSPSPDERVGQVEFAVPIKQKDGDETMHFTEEQISKAAEVMQMTTAYAKDAIKEISDEKTLILINACDSRKAIKEATEEAASKLFDGEANGQEESEGDE